MYPIACLFPLRSPPSPPSHCLGTYIVRIPDAIHELFVDLNYKKEEEDDQHDQWADHSPCHLPENVGLVADHELDVLVEPAAEDRGQGHWWHEGRWLASFLYLGQWLSSWDIVPSLPLIRSSNFAGKDVPE